MKNKAGLRAAAELLQYFANFLHIHKLYTFTGICKGEIIKDRKGNAGFGYDPVFQAKGYNQTFAEITLEEIIQKARDINEDDYTELLPFYDYDLSITAKESIDSIIKYLNLSSPPMHFFITTVG